MKVLSVKPLWAYWIVEGWKPVENRSWPAPRELIGKDFLIHASKSMTEREYEEAIRFGVKAGARALPSYASLQRGGIVGMVRLSGCVMKCASPWFVGKWGWLLTKPYPLPFRPCPGQLGLFDAPGY